MIERTNEQRPRSFRFREKTVENDMRFDRREFNNRPVTLDRRQWIGGLPVVAERNVKLLKKDQKNDFIIVFRTFRC